MRKHRKQSKVAIISISLVLVVLIALVVRRLPYMKEGGQPSKQEETSAARGEVSVEDQGLQPEEEREERERAAFLPDYASAPLLNTTDIKCLSMEVGAAEDEVQLNWFSPSVAKGQTEWKDSTGKVQSFGAQCTASITVPGYYVNKAIVTGLRKGEVYTYRVGNEGAWSPEYTYQVPKDTKEFTFLVTSDAQIGQSEIEYPKDTAERWDSVLTRLVQYVPEAQLLVHVGDQVADFGSQEQYELFQEHLALYSIPLVPVVGNHDVANEWSIEENGHPDGPYFYEHFFVPNRSNMAEGPYDMNGNYSFVRDNVLFIVLNSCLGHPGEFHEAYAAQIVSEFPNVKWRIVIQHYPAYSGVGSHGNGISGDYLANIAMDNDIDLVLTGHDHAYSRSAFLNREKTALADYDDKSGGIAVNPRGALYVTCGTSSGCLYHELEKDQEHLAFQGQPETPMAIRIDVTDSEMHLRTYLVDSWTLYDEYTIRKD